MTGGSRAREAKSARGAGTMRASIRCFVALQPDEAARERLDRLAAEQHARFPSARRMRRENIHLTLAFIGTLDAFVAKSLAVRLAAEPPAPFDWSLDTIGAFGGARVLWAGGADARLEALAVRVRRLLDETGVRYDRKPFVAHVTLLRKVPREAAREAQRIEPPVDWRAGAAVVLETRNDTDGVRYRPVAATGGSS